MSQLTLRNAQDCLRLEKKVAGRFQHTLWARNVDERMPITAVVVWTWTRADGRPEARSNRVTLQAGQRIQVVLLFGRGVLSDEGVADAEFSIR